MIYEQVKTLKQATLAHLWVVDLGDSVVESWFSPDEWKHLKSRLLELPPICENMARCMARFASVSQPPPYFILV